MQTEISPRADNCTIPENRYDATDARRVDTFLQIPRRLFILAASRQGVHLAADASFAIGMCFLPVDPDGLRLSVRLVEEVLAADNLPLLG